MSVRPRYRLEELSKLVSLCKRRGFVFPSSEIYGGFASAWDYGPLGSLLKANVKREWTRALVQERDDVVLLDSAILMHPKIWQASGHLEHFTDPLVDCKSCKQRFRADDLAGDRCPDCGGELTEVRLFNTMFKTFVGPVESDASVAYLRPETAQGIFVNFKSVQTTTRKKLPFGIAQVGKAFRNEITTGNFIFRVREFEQMELEFFVAPGTAPDWYQHWLDERMSWWVGLGLSRDRLRFYHKRGGDLAHYARAAADIEFEFPFGWGELEGIADRGSFDLAQHSEHSGEPLTYFDEDSKEHVRPEVIEPSAGVDRAVLAFLSDAYDEDLAGDETRVVLRLHPRVAPYQVAVLPLSKKQPLTELARSVQARLRRRYMTTFDETASIGRRYRRQDEIGTPFCVTPDFQSLEDQTVTVRERDSMQQERMHIEELPAWLAERIGD
ncbi:MAG: glycine--tRNA ligase [Chloroflexi bacterium]|nr:glycine--tRNA ligase [Chloroflexota bacterium]